MHIRWKKKTLASNRQNGEFLCPHRGKRPPVILTPVLMTYQEGSSVRQPHQKRKPRYREVWRPGPSIRKCCLGNPQAQAAWWWEVRQRFADLTKDDIEDNPILTRDILNNQALFEAFLETKIPKPSKKELNGYAAHREGPRRVKVKLPTFIKILGMTKWPCTEEELKSVWKKQALRHHPDRGGNPQEFIRIKAAYDRAISRLNP